MLVEEPNTVLKELPEREARSVDNSRMHKQSDASRSTDPRPLESEVAHLFSFALGMLVGANAERRIRLRSHTNFEDLPKGYSFAGGKLDYKAGDAVLQTGLHHWFLLELKRGYQECRDELEKPRVGRFKEYVQSQFGELAVLRNASFSRGMTAHRFLYLGRPVDRPHLELATLSYVAWLENVDSERPEVIKARSIPFTTFLLDAGRSIPGFTFDELAEYVSLLNFDESKGGLSGDEAAGMLAIAVDASGGAEMVLRDRLVALLALHRPDVDQQAAAERRRKSYSVPGGGGGGGR